VHATIELTQACNARREWQALTDASTRHELNRSAENGRRIRPLEELVHEEATLRAHLSIEELLALQLYTGTVSYYYIYILFTTTKVNMGLAAI
jgi:hypothetical protein